MQGRYYRSPGLSAGAADDASSITAPFTAAMRASPGPSPLDSTWTECAAREYVSHRPRSQLVRVVQLPLGSAVSAAL